MPIIIGLVLGVVGAAWLLLSRLPGPGPVRLDPNPSLQGGQVRVSGRGFYPFEPVSIRASAATDGGALVSLGQTEATFDGEVTAAYVALPDSLPSGRHRLEIVGQVSGRRATTTLAIRSKAPWMTLARSDIRPREILGLIVGGFAPGERVSFSIRPRTSPATVAGNPAVGTREAIGFSSVSTDEVGNSAWLDVRVPRLIPGAYSLVARGTASGQEVKRDLEVHPYQPSVELSPWAGPPGLKVQLNCRGFEPGEVVQVFLGSGSQPVAAIQADQYGNLWGAGPVHVPFGTLLGPLEIRLVGKDSGAQGHAVFRVLKPRPWLELTQYWGAPGGSVEFSGGGWAADERIAFHVGSALNPVVAYGKADDYGWLHNAGPVMIPLDATSEVVFVAVGEESHSQATATFKIVLPFGLRPAGTAPTSPTPSTGGPP